MKLAAILTGLLLVISFPPFDLLLPPFLALVPLLVFVAERPPGAEQRWRCARAGFTMGLIYFGLLLYWMVVALIYYSKLAIPAYVLSVLILGIFMGTFTALLHYTLERTRAPLALAAPLLWTAFEWLQGNLGDLSFPWLGLGSALHAFPRVAGAADLVGARGLTLWLALVNALIATTAVRLRARESWRGTAALALAVVVIPVGYGTWRAATLELRPAARVALVQPNIPEDLKLDRARAVDSSMTALANLTARIPRGTVDLIIWPEVAVPTVITHPREEPLLTAIRALTDRARAPVLAGAYGSEERDADDPLYFNSAFLVTPEGVRGAPYHKQFLVPFVERIPFIDPAWLEGIVGDVRYFGGLGRGRANPVFGERRARFGVLICYESIFAGLSRKYRRAGADYLVNVTNDAWYGREPWYARTTALWQHPAHLRMRAIEERVGIARAANTGISMFVDPLGRSYEETKLFEPDVRVGVVYTTSATTLYSLWGDWLATAATLAALALVILARFKPRTPE